MKVLSGESGTKPMVIGVDTRAVVEAFYLTYFLHVTDTVCLLSLLHAHTLSRP